MLNLPKGTRVFVSPSPIDMRRSFDGLAAAVRERMDLNPDGGDLFVFSNRRGHLIKILFFDKQGYCLLCKRMEKGVFKFPFGKEAKLLVDSASLEKLLLGKRLNTSNETLH